MSKLYIISLLINNLIEDMTENKILVTPCQDTIRANEFAVAWAKNYLSSRIGREAMSHTYEAFFPFILEGEEEKIVVTDANTLDKCRYAIEIETIREYACFSITIFAEEGSISLFGETGATVITEART